MNLDLQSLTRKALFLWFATVSLLGHGLHALPGVDCHATATCQLKHQCDHDSDHHTAHSDRICSNASCLEQVASQSRHTHGGGDEHSTSEHTCPICAMLAQPLADSVAALETPRPSACGVINELIPFLPAQPHSAYYFGRGPPIL